MIEKSVPYHTHLCYGMHDHFHIVHVTLPDKMCGDELMPNVVVCSTE